MRAGSRAGRRRPRAALAGIAAGVALVAGCGGSGAAAPPADEPSALLREAATALRRAGTFEFEFEAVRVRGDRPNRPETVYAGSGAIDLATRRGRMELDLAGLLPDEHPPGESNPFADPIELRWNEDTLYGEVDGRAASLGRARARESGGLMGDAPDEPEGLAELLSRGRQAHHVDGGARLEFVVDMRTAGVHGTPFELEPEAARKLLGPRLTMTATLDDERRPEEISYRYRLQPVRDPDTNRLVLPRRTVTVTYRLSEFGEQVDVGPPER